VINPDNVILKPLELVCRRNFKDFKRCRSETQSLTGASGGNLLD
jgi:hypothetical protein